MSEGLYEDTVAPYPRYGADMAWYSHKRTCMVQVYCFVAHYLRCSASVSEIRCLCIWDTVPLYPRYGASVSEIQWLSIRDTVAQYPRYSALWFLDTVLWMSHLDSKNQLNFKDKIVLSCFTCYMNKKDTENCPSLRSYPFAQNKFYTEHATNDLLLGQYLTHSSWDHKGCTALMLLSHSSCDHEGCTALMLGLSMNQPPLPEKRQA